jgi:hypothetical protein
MSSPSPAPIPPGDNHGDRQTKKHKKKNFVQRTSAFEGKCESIKQHVYDVTPGENGFDVFSKTTTEIGEYIASNVANAGEFTLVMRPDNLGFPTLTPPEDVIDQTNMMEVEHWKDSNRRYQKAMEQRDENRKCAYAIVWGQCSPTVQDGVKASTNYAAINSNLDLIGLLGLICTSMYTGATSKDKIHLLLEAMDRFHAFKQGPCMDNATYLRVFQNHIEAIDHLDGDFGVHNALIVTRMIDNNEDPDNKSAWITIKEAITEEVVAKYLLMKSDPKRYASLLASIQNNYVSGSDRYPKTLTKSYDMVVNYVNPHKHGGIDAQDLGMSFYQDDDARQAFGRNARGGHGRGREGRGRDSSCGDGRRSGIRDCGGRYAQGGRQQQSDNDDEYDHNYELEEEEEEIGGAGNDTNNNNSRGYPLVSSTSSNSSPSNLPVLTSRQSTVTTAQASVNVCAAEQFALQRSALPNKWLLLDSCSTIDIVANADRLHDIQRVGVPTWVRCNAGRVQLMHQGYLGDYPCPV